MKPAWLSDCERKSKRGQGPGSECRRKWKLIQRFRKADVDLMLMTASFRPPTGSPYFETHTHTHTHTQ
jgi:glyoxylate utilization-related uncharacterized protein